MENEKYLRQFIAEISGRLDEELVNFFNQKGHTMEFPEQDLTRVVDDALEEYFERKTKREDLIPIVLKIKKSRGKKKQRWYTTYMNDATVLNIQDMNNPLYALAYTAQTLSADNYYKLYGHKTLDELLAEEIERTNEWKNNRKCWLISYPGIHMISHEAVYSTFKSDIAICAWQYINDELNGSIDLYVSKFPTVMLEKPMFSPTSFKMTLQKENNVLKEIVLDDDNKNILETVISTATNSDGSARRVMDSCDLKILNIMMSNISNSFYSDKSVQVEMRTLMKSVYSANPSSDNYKKMETRLKKFLDYSFSITSGKDKTYFNLVDNIKLNKDEINNTTIIDITFGEILYDAVVTNKLVSVTNNSLSAIENPLSRIIYYAVQKARISTVQGKNRTGTFTYTYFQRIARFRSKIKKKNLETIVEALQEFADKEIAIHSFVLKEDIFYIDFIPLSKEEEEDLSLNN